MVIDVKLMLIFYYVWVYCGVGVMVVWLLQELSVFCLIMFVMLVLESKVDVLYKVKFIFVINDCLVLKDENDCFVFYYYWWFKQGIIEWIFYEFLFEVIVFSVIVYWYDDVFWGGCCIL